ncbi:tetratricopeptide repeat protein [Deinococcus sp. NW-56]|uniref:tetratricopeptide repeat protein n=1 Tax=Deinococcus sp. NW-56 TaxID=2080419 RepID=UPI000CF3784D|nr:tetratricopeptide repeat protein [Deinococcus sp. NW-56]
MYRFILTLGAGLLSLGLLAHAQQTAPPKAPLSACEQLYEQKAYADAAQACEPVAEAGNAQAQLILGLLYLGGLEVPGNPQRAVVWLMKAAGQKVAEAQYQLGMAYLSGTGLSAPNLVTGVEWLLKAAEQQHPAALAELGNYYTSQLQDYEKGASYTRRAACLGNVTAQRNMVRILYYGIGNVKNCRQAAWWARRAAEKDELSRSNYRIITSRADCLPDAAYNPCAG